MNKFNELETYFKHFSTEKCHYRIFRTPEQLNYQIELFTKVEVSDLDLVRNGPKEIGNKLQKMRDNILNSKLFDYERKSLQKYEELKNMQFVLEQLNKLDLSSIKEVKTEPEYIDIRKMLGGK